MKETFVSVCGRKSIARRLSFGTTTPRARERAEAAIVAAAGVAALSVLAYHAIVAAFVSALAGLGTTHAFSARILEALLPFVAALAIALQAACYIYQKRFWYSYRLRTAVDTENLVPTAAWGVFLLASALGFFARRAPEFRRSRQRRVYRWIKVFEFDALYRHVFSTGLDLPCRLPGSLC